MHSRIVFSAAGILFACLWATPAPAQDTDSVRAVVEEAHGSFIFVFRPDFPAAEVPGQALAHTQEQGAVLRHVFTTALKGFSAQMSDQAAALLAQRHPHILYYERNGVAWASEQPLSTQAKPGAGEPPQVTPPGITRVGGPADGTGRHAWVIDTGIDLNHPDLNVGKGANFVGHKNKPDDGNGHGTHVAGTIAAINNGIGVVGVAANATVHPVRVLGNNGSGTIDEVVAGVDFVAANAAAGDCANMSLGASGHFQSLHDAVLNSANLGIRFAIAAGNSSAHAGNFEPAHVEHANVYTISAVDAGDVFASFSNFGNPPVDFAAPGVNILSTKVGGGVTTLSGTSMATPHVCGILLFGVPVGNGAAIGDPDGFADPIAHF